jgi:hypothetical protein
MMLCDVAAPSEAMENTTMVAMSARARPMRSAMKPKMMPPHADIASVTVPSNPAVASSIAKYCRS